MLDRFSNLCRVESLEGLTVPSPAARQAPPGVFHLEAGERLSSAGSSSMTAAPDPYGVYEGYSILFGDLHTHSAYSYDCAERERMHRTPADYYRYARDTACLDFLAVTDHHVPWGEERRKIGRENWERTLEAARLYHQPDDFLAFPGLEVKDARGDTTLILGEDFSYEEITHPSLVDLLSLWERYRGRNYLGIPHFHNPGSLPAGTWRACPYEGVEPVVEISSCHGTYEAFGPEEPAQPLMEHERPDRCGRFLLWAGYRYGFICNSDGHKGNPGQNGLTAVYVKERTREAVLDALRQRRAYGNDQCAHSASAAGGWKADGFGSTFRLKQGGFSLGSGGERAAKRVGDRQRRGGSPLLPPRDEVGSAVPIAGNSGWILLCPRCAAGWSPGLFERGMVPRIGVDGKGKWQNGFDRNWQPALHQSGGYARTDTGASGKDARKRPDAHPAVSVGSLGAAGG
ncbi:MAG: hypothetical protein HFG26_12680 [Provencibacterium sp.]|nr:hypothetical protein [Provencibacterium sp.]